MMAWVLFAVLVLFMGAVAAEEGDCCQNARVATWGASWGVFPTASAWSLQTRIPMTPDFDINTNGEERGKFKVKKKFKKFLLPLLLAYKLKFFTLVPVLIGLLVLLTGATGLAGFFFALFTAVMGIKAGFSHHH